MLILLMFGVQTFTPGQTSPARLSTDLDTRHDLLQVYDSSKAGLTDTNRLEINRVFRAFDDLLSVDNSLIQDQIPTLNHKKDSLELLIKDQQASLQEETEKTQQYTLWFFYASIVTLASLALTLIMFVVWLSKSRVLKKIRSENDKGDKLISEYRKQVQVLQNDLENSQLQSKTLIHEVSRLEKENVGLKEELHKAREAGLAPAEGQPTYQEAIRSLEQQLADENKKKMILEQELKDLLRKIRNED